MAIPLDPLPISPGPASPPASLFLAEPGEQALFVARRPRVRRRPVPARSSRPARAARPRPAPAPAAPASSSADAEEARPLSPAAAGPAAARSDAAADSANLQRGGRIEFDGRLVQGQTAKSGAIYLFARKSSALRSMVKERTSYHKEIVRTIYPSWDETQ